MANSDSPIGLRPVRYRSGAPYNGAANPYYLPSSYATAMFIGDPVVVTGTSNTAAVTQPGVGNFQPGTLPEINKSAAASGTITGVIVGFAASPSNLENQYNPASTERIALVADDPTLLFEVQEDSDGGALAATDVGLNAELIFGSGSTVTGISGVELDSSTAATTAGHLVQIVGLMNREDNEIGTNANWLVSLNASTYANGRTGL